MRRFTHSRPMKRPILPLSLAATLIAGCQKPAAPAAPPAAATPPMPTRAQPKLQTLKLWVGSEELITELALTGIQQQTGMMFRTNMAENEAMLFPMPYNLRASFWMTNCPLPLSVAYIRADGVIQEIHPLQPFNIVPVESATNNIRFALETPHGWFDRHSVRTGMVVRTERGPLYNTFFQR